MIERCPACGDYDGFKWYSSTDSEDGYEPAECGCKNCGFDWYQTKKGQFPDIAGRRWAKYMIGLYQYKRDMIFARQCRLRGLQMVEPVPPTEPYGDDQPFWSLDQLEYAIKAKGDNNGTGN